MRLEIDTVNSLLSPSGRLFYFKHVEGGRGLNRKGGLFKRGGSLVEKAVEFPASVN